MALYADPATHAANPPATWRVVKARKGLWRLVDANGTPIDSYPRKRDAERGRTDGHAAKLWETERRWYAGEPVAGWRPYADILAERARIKARWG